MIEVGPAPRVNYGWIADRAQLSISDGFRAIQATSGGRILGMVGYDGWTPNSCCMHVAIDEPIAVRRLIRPAFGIPFDELGREVALASILSTNKRSLEFVRHLGFKRLCRIRDGWAKGVDVILHEMRREDWHWRGH